jgi:2-isopropylmalate synthase
VKGQLVRSTAEGDGPVNALDAALRSALTPFFPQVASIKLEDYKVRSLDRKRGTASKTRALIHSTDGRGQWGTVGVDDNVIEASISALVDSIEIGLIKELRPGHQFQNGGMEQSLGEVGRHPLARSPETTQSQCHFPNLEYV